MRKQVRGKGSNSRTVNVHHGNTQKNDTYKSVLSKDSKKNGGRIVKYSVIKLFVL
jgi:hypothetical protein